VENRPCRIYLARLDQLRPGHDGLLTETEARRADRFRFAADRNRFVLATALLRLAVAERTGSEAAAVRLDRSCDLCGEQHGRPRLPGTGLHASISHSGDVVAVALTGCGPVGVDVEEIGPRDYEPLIPRVCGPEEQPHVGSAGDFYAYWTRKEAVLKATGSGLRMPMTKLTVTPPGSAPALLALDGDPPPCQLTDVTVGPGYAAAIAVLTAAEVPIRAADSAALLARPGGPAAASRPDGQYEGTDA
jgi:4'-phosphopantetheinyl transferase